MSNHLTPEQISRCLIGDTTAADLAHTRDCPQCAAELAGAERAFSQFRASVVHWADAEGASKVPEIAVLDRTSHRTILRRFQLLTMAAVIAVLAAIPVYKRSIEQKHEIEAIQESNYDTELLERVNVQLSRTAPVSLEPLQP